MIIDKNNIAEIQKIETQTDIVLSLTLSDLDLIDVILEVQKKNVVRRIAQLRFTELSYEQRINIIKYALTHFDLTEYTIIINVINLIKNYNQLSDDFFNDDTILINSLVEFLDIKTLFDKEISVYITELAKCYFSILSSVHKIELNYLDNPRDIEQSFYVIITILDFYTLSGIISKAKSFNTCELYIVKNAYMIMQYLTNKFKVSNSILTTFMTENT